MHTSSTFAEEEREGRGGGGGGGETEEETATRGQDGCFSLPRGSIISADSGESRKKEKEKKRTSSANPRDFGRREPAALA